MKAVSWQEIIGHEQQIGQLKHMLETGQLQHALLFTGPEGVGKMTAATLFAAAVLCENLSRQGEACGECPSCRRLVQMAHPDFIKIAADGQTIKIDQIRAMQQAMSVRPLMGSYRICVIEGAELMTDQAANSLLKLLEEPPAYLIFILTANRRYSLLDTIVSRCRSYRFETVAVNLITGFLTERGVPETLARTAARMSGGRVGLALRLAQPEGFTARDEAIGLLMDLAALPMQRIWDIAAGLNDQDDKTVLELLTNIGCCLRDLAMVKTGVGAELAFSADQLERLSELAAGWSRASLIKAYAAVRQAQRAIGGNANTRLTIESLFMELTEYRGGQTGADGGWNPV